MRIQSRGIASDKYAGIALAIIFMDSIETLIRG